MSVSQVHRQSYRNVVVRSGRIEQAFKQLWPRTEPSPAVFLLSPRGTERSTADQRLAGIGPAEWMRVMRVVVIEEAAERVLEHFGRGKVASLEKAARQNAEP